MPVLNKISPRKGEKTFCKTLKLQSEAPFMPNADKWYRKGLEVVEFIHNQEKQRYPSKFILYSPHSFIVELHLTQLKFKVDLMLVFSSSGSF